MTDSFRFSSTRARVDRNPYVERIHEWAPWALSSDEAEAGDRDWRARCGVAPDAPLFLEIGPGNGFFFREVARRWPDAAVVGVEIRFKRVWLTAKKALDWGLTNFRVVHHHSGHIDALFAPASLDAVFVNHPDPWPRDRHHKHRLLQPEFVRRLEGLMKPGAEFWLKSDFAPYGPLARELFATWPTIVATPDLHGSGLLESAPAARFWAADIRTNYEEKFLKLGTPILVAGHRRP